MARKPDRVGRDSWLLGTGLSAPAFMLALQSATVVRLVTRPSLAATRVLGGLGATMTCGYLIEREFCDAVSPAGWNPTTTPIAAAGFTLALAMAVTGLREPSAGEEGTAPRSTKVGARTAWSVSTPEEAGWGTSRSSAGASSG